MRCPRCNESSRVSETRALNHVTRRRRVCLSKKCAFKFWSVEIAIGRTFPFQLVMGPLGPQVVLASKQAEVVKTDEQT